MGCSKVSPGCAHCYAETITLRFKRGGPFLPGKATIRLHHDRLDDPRGWRKSRRVFVNSMSDLSRDGYGVVGSRKAHRVVWNQVHPEWDGAGQVLHLCHRRRCIQPGHLYIGND